MIQSTNMEEDEKSIEINENKRDVNSRSDILKKARDAKRRKKEDNDVFIDVYNKQLENIHNHLRMMNTQMNTISGILADKKVEPQITEIQKIAKIEPKIENQKNSSPEESGDEKSVSESFIGSKYSYLIGEAVALSLVGGGLYYFKTKPKNNPAHDKYSSII